MLSSWPLQHSPPSISPTEPISRLVSYTGTCFTASHQGKGPPAGSASNASRRMWPGILWALWSLWVASEYSEPLQFFGFVTLWKFLIKFNPEQKPFYLQLRNTESCLSGCNRNKKHPGHFHGPDLPVFCAHRTCCWLLLRAISAASPIALWAGFAVFFPSHTHTLWTCIGFGQTTPLLNPLSGPEVGPLHWMAVTFIRCFTLLRVLIESEGKALSALIRSMILGKTY